MFGYVRPVLNLMSAEEKNAYKSVYCGLCHMMGQRHGWLSRLTLNYDFTLLALLHYASGTNEQCVCRRCPIHPFQEPRTCLCGPALETAADESMILLWHKLSDDVEDHGFITGIPARFLRCIFRKSYLNAAKARPAFDQTVRQELDRLHELERDRSPQLDRVADTFARILSAAVEDCNDVPRRRAMEQLLYHLGRWIYLVDAWDDLDHDCKTGSYNPLDARFDGTAQNEREYVETTMTHSTRLIHSAANLIEFGLWQPIVENILYHGLPSVQSAVLEGRWKELRKQGRKTNERSV